MEEFSLFIEKNNRDIDKAKHSESVKDSFSKIIDYTLSSPKKVIRNCPRILIDASLIIDVLLKRDSIHLKNASRIMDYVISKQLNGYITEPGLKDIWDLARKLKGDVDANYLILKLLNSFGVCMIDSQTILNAQKYHLNSFETGIQVECVDKYQLDAIITLRYRDFLECGFINFFSPQEFVESYDAKKQNRLEINSTETKLNRTVAISFLKNQAEENEKILLFDGWEIEHFDLTCSGGSMSSATVVIVNNQSKYRQCRYSESAFGVGATATLFSAFDKVIRHIVDDSNYILDSIKVSKMEKGVDGSVIADLVVKYDNQNIRKYYGHKNVIKACFHAYVEAINVIYNPDTEDSTCDQTASLSPVTKVSLEEVIEKYNSGIRQFVKNNLEHSNFVGVNLPEIDLSYSSLSWSNLEKANLSRANLTEAFIKKATITNAILSGATLYKAQLNDSIFRGSRLDYAEMIKADLSRACLTDVDLTNADLTGANLTNVELINANLTGANLTRVNLSHANLTGVNLTNSNIDGANFSEANLSNANLRGLDLNNTVFCKPILTDTAMPEIKIEIYGQKRIERMILLFNQFKSRHYDIFAVYSNPFGIWWNNNIGIKFRQVNKELRTKGISIKRVFIIPEDNFDNEMYEIIKEQVDLGIEVRCLSEKFAANFNGFNLRTTNLLVCKNLSVEDNSFTTTMIFDEKHKQETSGYISFIKNDLKVNEQRFNMIWEKAETYSDNSCGRTKASC